MQTNMNSRRENEALSDISHELFYVTIVLCLNILLKQSIKVLLGKHELAYVGLNMM